MPRGLERRRAKHVPLNSTKIGICMNSLSILKLPARAEAAFVIVSAMFWAVPVLLSEIQRSFPHEVVALACFAGGRHASTRSDRLVKELYIETTTYYAIESRKEEGTRDMIH